MGNMYEWVYETRYNPLAGECSHECDYCYMSALKNRFGMKKYEGKPRLRLDVLNGLPAHTEDIIFIGSACDIFAENVPSSMISSILDVLKNHEGRNKYLLQTKNPARFDEFAGEYPENVVLCTTIETNRQELVGDHSQAPTVTERYYAMRDLSDVETSVTIEPIMDFDLHVLLLWMKDIAPNFISIGANSGNIMLEEPDGTKVVKLIRELEKFTEVHVKDTLTRLVDGLL